MTIKMNVDGEGFSQAAIFEIEDGSSYKELAVLVADKAGIPREEILLTIEDGDEILDMDILIKDHPERHKVHHAHRCSEVHVDVHYEKETEPHKFRPAVRIQKILDWAVGVKKFKIDPTIAPEMQLQLVGTVTALPAGAHIGRYAKHGHCKVELDLVRGDIHQGHNGSI